MGIYGNDSAPKTELLINGTWTDLSSRPRAEQKIVITRGRSNEQASVTAQTAQASLNNRDGVLSNRNPMSPYFGLLPRNTRMRVTAGTDTAGNFLRVPYSDSSTLVNVATADKAALDIVGDIDIRCDIQPYSWRRPGKVMALAAKGTLSGSQLSWAFSIGQDGTVRFAWYPAGTGASQISTASTAAIPVTSGRLTLRVTLDVDNGASGNTTTFYTSDSVTGTFTQLGATIVKSGVTSIFSGSAPVTMAGGGTDVQGFFSNGVGFGGRFYRGQIYSGIAGTLRADMNATTRTAGDTSWSDGLSTPNTWTLTGPAIRVTNDRIRFVGELSSLPQVWDVTGTDVYVPVTASGILRRLTQGADALNSPMYRNFSQYSPIGYWPLEDGQSATSAASAVPNGRPGLLVNTSLGSSDPALPGSASYAQFNDSTSSMIFTCQTTASTGTISLVFYVKVSALPTTQKVFLRLNMTGAVRQVAVSLASATWNVELFAGDGTSLSTISTGVTGIDPSKGWVGYNLLLQASGGNVNYSVRWDTISGFGGGIGPFVATAGAVGIPTTATFNAVADVAFQNAQLAQVFLATQNLDLTNDSFRKASSAWLGETAVARINRLAAEENEPVETWGLAAESEIMGYQTVDTFVNLLYDCAQTDGGMLSECRDVLSIQYRSRTALENRSDVTFDYAQSHLSAVPLPTEDDQGFTNDVTVTAPAGTSARVQITDGPTSVSDPPAGVGRYATAPALNVGDPDHLPSSAGWLAFVGSWDDARYPSLAVALHRAELTGNTALATQVMALEIGDTGDLINLPPWLPPDDVPELVQGYTEALDKFTWTMAYNASPAGPYQLAPVLGSDVLAVRLDATTHTTGATMTTGATSVTFVTPAGSAVWVDSTNYPAEFPFAVRIAGEVMTVTAISGTSSPQTATLTRSVNGIVKTHASGEPVRLNRPPHLGR